MYRLMTQLRNNGLISTAAARSSRGFSSHTGRLHGKVALITGGASGIGKATVAKFIQNGAKVLIADIQPPLQEDTSTEFGQNACFVHCDVTKESDVSEAVNLAISKHGKLDIMYNNAGVVPTTAPSIANLNLTTFDHVMATNVRGVIAGIKHASRVMIPRQSGCILCTASITGVMGGMAQHPYAVSKATVIGIVKSVASELGKHGIRVNCISPYLVLTPLVMEGLKSMYPGHEDQWIVDTVRELGSLKGAVCEAIDIANAAVYLASDDAKYVSGQNLVVDGGFTTFKSLGLPPPDQM
ncbi:hypothetical protein Nepgr_022320 [Nepenthes gracilis]|uniref:Secoisolariciresinol dehydrogenase n=1 Tax=Nepenthes gracilis TaxID=150966 RepID=A0AAD3T0P1_NEPGR|nr:hypothetical protein Nepgr_022320 [Nepenthes gracilis]